MVSLISWKRLFPARHYRKSTIYMLSNLETSLLIWKHCPLTPIREFWTKNPNSGIWVSVISGQKIQQNSKILILGIELASFLDKKSRPFFLIYPHKSQKIFFWELSQRHFWTKHPMRIIVSRFGDFFKESYFGSWASVIFGQKNQTTFYCSIK